MGASRLTWRLCIFVSLLLVLMPLSFADDAVSFAQSGSPKEPFDVYGTITYRIPIDNNISYNMLYTVDLKVGSDKKYPFLFKKYNTQLNVNAHSVGHAVFDVNFNSEEIYKGEFGAWASDKNDTSTWNEAWYSATITPLVGRSKVLENYEGSPQLYKPFFEFRNATVNPTQGSNKDHYSYEATAFGSYGDNISLQVGPTKDGPWIDMGVKEYTTPGLIQTLKWNNITLDFDFTMAYYRFKGTRQSKTFVGPFWPVVMSTRNSSVSPERGLSSTQFTYSLELNSSKKIDVGLNVLDVASKIFKPAGRISYTNTSRWERLERPGIQPSEIAGSEGSSSYYFTFYYPGSETPFNKTKLEAGPDIMLVNFKNESVSPGNGSALTMFNFSVEIDTGQPRCDVELQTAAPASSSGSSKWMSQGTVTYDGSSRRLYWRDIKVDGVAGGLARYRFICGQSVSEVYNGPEIRAPEVIGTVTPAEGITQAFTETNSLYSFTYTAQFKNWTESDDLWVELLVRTPNSSWKTIGEKKQYDPATGNITWRAKPFNDLGFLGTAEFKFLLNGEESRVFQGPVIFANYKGLDFKEAGSGKYDYMASVNGSKDLTVDLIYSTDEENWINVGKPQNYAAGTGWKPLAWPGLPAYYFYELDIRGPAGEAIYDA